MQAGDTLYTASMVPIMSFLEDSGPGVHDTTAAACSYGLYVLQIGEVSLSILNALGSCMTWEACKAILATLRLHRQAWALPQGLCAACMPCKSTQPVCMFLVPPPLKRSCTSHALTRPLRHSCHVMHFYHPVK